MELTLAEQIKEEGKIEGKMEGLKEGEYKKAIETARRMKEDNFDLSTILRITGLSKSDLKENGIL
ncbi:MAG: hypothetical protein D6767_07235 [Candidatus Hydrogenedentota bacterium]|nr:MAG: hypothetical protein D6767_07235 [Candidatus Hydrogenedentota bacterium]